MAVGRIAGDVMKFQVGDRVRVVQIIDTAGESYKDGWETAMGIVDPGLGDPVCGMEGIVTKVIAVKNASSRPILVAFNEGDPVDMYEEELELM